MGHWFESCFMNDVGSIFKDFCAQCNMAEGTISSALPSRNQLFHFLIVVLSSWFFLRFWVGFWSILGSKIDQKSIKNLFKNRSKIRCHFELILDGSWIDLDDFGPKLGAKLGPSWSKNLSKMDIKIMSKKVSKKWDAKLCRVVQSCPEKVSRDRGCPCK